MGKHRPALWLAAPIFGACAYPAWAGAMAQLSTDPGATSTTGASALSSAPPQSTNAPPPSPTVPVKVAVAQATAAPPTSQVQNAPPRGANASASSDPNAVSEIVVTAEKTPTSLQHTPAAVTAISGTALVNAGITSPLGLANVVPGATFRTRGPVTQLFIRGVGSNVDSPQVLPSVATQFDQIYVPREATGGSFYDLADVEILPGPQGTLYGRDAAGGTVNVSFQKPRDESETTGLLELGNYSLVHFTGVENIPLDDKLMFRAAFDLNQHDGYLSNDADDLESRSVRLSLLAKPIENLSILAWTSYWFDGGHGPQVVANPMFKPSDPWFQPSTVPAGTTDFTTTMFGGQVDWKVKGVTLTYIPGYSYYKENSFASFASPALFLHAPAAAFTLHINQHWNNYSQELRASGNTSSLQWLAAGYYYNQQIHYDRHQTTQLSQVTSTVITIPQQINSGYAGYGQITYSPLAWLHLTGGGRASVDSLDVHGENSGARVPFTFSHDFPHVDWKVGAQADLNSTSNVYATIQTGFLRGGYSPGAIGKAGQVVPTTEVKPENLLSYTVGTKNKFFDSRLILNDELFYYNYRDFQVSAIDLTTNVSSFYNAQKAEIYGDQADGSFLLTHNDKLTGSVTFSRSRALIFNIAGVGNFNGFSLPNSPALTASLGIQHTLRLASGDKFVFQGDSHFASQSFLLYNHPNGSRQPDYTQSDLTLTYYPHYARWDIALWVRNVEDKAVYGAGATVGPIGAVYLGDPRTFGGRISAAF